MNDLRIRPDEAMLVDPTVVYSDDLKGREWYCCLTDKRLILYKTALFSLKRDAGKIKEFEEFQLNEIKMRDEKPNIIVKDNVMGFLEVSFYFFSGQVKLRFGDKTAGKEIVSETFRLLTGETNKKVSKGFVFGAAAVADTLGESISVFKKGLGIKTKNDEVITQFCQMCGASISGKHNEVVQCPYCGAKFTLK